jgi:ABC-type polysaccharide/polyol phosphate export permease
MTLVVYFKPLSRLTDFVYVEVRLLIYPTECLIVYNLAAGMFLSALFVFFRDGVSVAGFLPSFCYICPPL